MIARPWGCFLLAFGASLLALLCATWAVFAVILLPFMPASAGRRLGRRVATGAFHLYLAVMEALGAWRLDLGALDELRDAGPLIIAPNHPGLLDAVFVISRLPDTICVMKVSLLGNFLLGPAARLARYVRNDTLLRLIARARDEMAAGGQLLLFPEGTRTVGDPIGPLTEAVGALSRRTGVAVQAVIIEDGVRFLGKGWPLTRVPDFPLTYRVRLGRRFEPPVDVRAFTLDLQRHLTRELQARTQESQLPHPAAPIAQGAQGAPPLRG